MYSKLNVSESSIIPVRSRHVNTEQSVTHSLQSEANDLALTESTRNTTSLLSSGQSNNGDSDEIRLLTLARKDEDNIIQDGYLFRPPPTLFTLDPLYNTYVKVRYGVVQAFHFPSPYRGLSSSTYTPCFIYQLSTFFFSLVIFH